jgi:menaquinone-dependent protoporphyrinogen oxidase
MTAVPGTRVLVGVASRHGSTFQIGERIAAVVRAELATDLPETAVDLRALDTAPGPDLYHAVVLGSAIYMGRWLRAARRYVRVHGPALRDRPVWIFSSGPSGDPPQTGGEPGDLARIIAATGARSHHVFAGHLDFAALGRMEKAIAKAAHATPGDYRDWADIDVYATRVAREIIATTTRKPGTA